MKRTYIPFFLGLFITLLLMGCAKVEPPLDKTPTETIKNSVELDLIWENNLEFQQANSFLVNETLYVLAEENVLYTINYSTGEILDSYKLRDDDGNFKSIAIEGDYIAVNYVNSVFVYNMVTKEEVFKKVVTKAPIVIFKSVIILKNDVLIVSNLETRKIHGYDYLTGNELWTIDSKIQNEIFNLIEYSEKNIFHKRSDGCYYSFNSKTGEILDKYVVGEGIELLNENYSVYYPLFDIEDEDLFMYLTSRSLAFFKELQDGNFISSGGSILYYYDEAGNLKWTKEFNQNIKYTNIYKQYVILKFSDKVVIFDTDVKKNVWTFDVESAVRSRLLINNNTLYLPSRTGEIRLYDLSKLK